MCCRFGLGKCGYTSKQIGGLAFPQELLSTKGPCKTADITTLGFTCDGGRTSHRHQSWSATSARCGSGPDAEARTTLRKRASSTVFGHKSVMLAWRDEADPAPGQPRPRDLVIYGNKLFLNSASKHDQHSTHTQFMLHVEGSETTTALTISRVTPTPRRAARTMPPSNRHEPTQRGLENRALSAKGGCPDGEARLRPLDPTRRPTPCPGRMRQRQEEAPRRGGPHDFGEQICAPYFAYRPTQEVSGLTPRAPRGREGGEAGEGACAGRRRWAGAKGSSAKSLRSSIATPRAEWARSGRNCANDPEVNFSCFTPA